MEHRADINTYLGLALTFQCLSRIPCVFHKIPNGLQKKTTHGIHNLRFPRRDIEKQGIEPVYTVYDPSPAAVGFPRFALFFIEEQIMVPAVCRNFCYTIPAGFQVFPEFMDVFRSGIPTAKPDDGHVPNPCRFLFRFFNFRPAKPEETSGCLKRSHTLRRRRLAGSLIFSGNGMIINLFIYNPGQCRQGLFPGFKKMAHQSVNGLIFKEQGAVYTIYQLI